MQSTDFADDENEPDSINGLIEKAEKMLSPWNPKTECICQWRQSIPHTVERSPTDFATFNFSFSIFKQRPTRIEQHHTRTPLPLTRNQLHDKQI